MQLMSEFERKTNTSGAIILPYQRVWPEIADSAWLAPGSVVIGNTRIAAECSIWFGAILRGDVNTIRIGRKSNIQDGAVLHVTIARAPLEIHDHVTIAHGAVVHGCTLESGCLVGIGARVLDRSVVGSGSIVAAGSVVLEETKIPGGELWAGVPAKKRRDLSNDEIKGLLDTAERYVLYRLEYMGQAQEIPDSWLPRR